MVITIISAGTAFSEPVAAASHDADSSMTNAEIQSIIDSADLGDTINFLAGVYNNIALTITNALNLVSNGAVLNSDAGNTVLTVSGANSAGTNITGFAINGNGTTYGISAANTVGLNIANNTFNNTQRAVTFSNVNESSIVSNKINNNTNYGIFISNTGNLTSRNNVLLDGNRLLNSAGGFNLAGSGYTVTNNYVGMNGNNGGVYGKNLYSVLVENNTFLNGKDGINVFQNYRNFTVNNNTIVGMTRDGISFVNDKPANIETVTSTSITKNVVSGNQEYGLFLGGNFQGNVVDNVIDGSTVAGVNITGKSTSSLGLLNANVTGNDITNTSGIGVAMESPNVQYLKFSNNVVDSDGFSIQYNQYFRNNGVMIQDKNVLSEPQNFIVDSSMTNDYIQSLIDSANLGDTVTFLSGVYNNIALTINKAVNLVSNGAILNNNETSATLTVSGNGASGTNITGFTINGTGNNVGVSLNSVKNVTVSENNIINNSVGVEVKNSQNNSINENNIHENTNGVTLSESDDNEVASNNIYENDGNAVSVKNSNNNLIASNNIYTNENDGMSLNNSDNNTVTDNTVNSNNGNGISVKSSTGNQVSHNTVYGNTKKGINADTSSASANNFTNNSISGNGVTVDVSNVDPTNDATNVSVNKNIIVTFGDNVKWGNSWVELQTSNGASVAFTKSISANTLTITPTSTLSNGVKYMVLLHTASVTDLVGNPLSAYLSAFTTTNPFTVTAVDPANGAVGVANNKTVTVTFNKDVKWGSGWVELQTSTGTPVSFTKSIFGNTLTINPTGALSCGVKYLVLLHTGSLTDLSGNAINSYLSSFTVTPTPVVSSVDPVNGAVGVANNKTVTVTFNKDVKWGSGWVELQTSNGTSVAFTKSIVGNTLTINPTGALSCGVKYLVLIHTGSLTDLFGNAVSSYLSSFTVTPVPTVSSVDPVNGAVNVATSKVITITFNKAVKLGSGWVELQTSTGTPVSFTKSIVGNTLTITPTSALSSGVKYMILIHTGSLTDLFGNGVSSYLSMFTTKSA